MSKQISDDIKQFSYEICQKHKVIIRYMETVERRLSGCVVDQGQVPPKDESQTMIELLYFLAYMSNDMPVDGPDVRK